MLEVMPFWLARYPRQDLMIYEKKYSTTASTGYFGPINMYGASVTQLLYRWNFQRYPGSRNLPWAQLGVGLSAFVSKRQSLDLGVKVVHIYSVSLGDNDLGVTTLQFSVGYSWWK